MSGFGRRNREAHRRRIAHLADDDHVWRLADGSPERGGIVRDIHPELLLFHEALVVLMLELNRILDGDYVSAVSPVDLSNQGGERRRLAGTGRPADHDETATESSQELDGM